MSSDECYLFVLLALLPSDGVRKSPVSPQTIAYGDNPSDMRHAYVTNRSYFDAYLQIVIALNEGKYP